jgi:hypothetical protein
MFAVGSMIVAVETHLGVGGVRRLTKDDEYQVINCNEAYVRVKDDRGQECQYYLRRFKEKEQEVAKPKEIKVGSHVVCVDDSNSRSLVFGKVYCVESYRETQVKLLGVGSWFNKTRFKLTEKKQEPVNPPPKKEPNLLEQLTEKVGNNAGTCSYAIKFTNNHIRYQVRDACHARIFFPYWGEEAVEKEVVEIAFNVSGHVQRAGEGYREYVDYIINHSPWASVFIGDKNVDNVLKSGVCADVNRTLSEVACAAIALRVGSEFKSKLPLFKYLTDNGFDPHASWIVSQMAEPKGGGAYNLNPFGGGHHVFTTEMDFEQVVEFFTTGKFKGTDDKKPYAKSFREAYTILLSMADNSKESVMNTVLKLKGGEIKNGQWGGQSFFIPDAKSLHVFMNQFQKFFYTK